MKTAQYLNFILSNVLQCECKQIKIVNEKDKVDFNIYILFLAHFLKILIGQSLGNTKKMS